MFALLGCLLLLLHAGVLHAAPAAVDLRAPFEQPWFNRVDMSDGLPHSVTTALAQDSDGLIWIGTVSGLARYDGYRMQTYEERARGVPGLPDAYVRALLALPGGGLLVGTNAGGLTRFDPSSNSFHDYPTGAGGLSDRKIYALAWAQDGGVWVATDRGLDHLNLKTGRVMPVALGPAPAPRSFSVRQDRQGNLWLGNERGLFVRYPGRTDFVRPPRPPGAVNDVLDDQIWSIVQDDAGRLWVGSGQAGAVYLDAQGHWHAVPGFSGYANGTQQVTTRDFLAVGTDTVWIGTDGDGVLVWHVGSPAVRPITQDPAIASSLPGDTVRALLADRSDNVWVATDLGAVRTDRRARTAFSLLPSDRNPLALSGNNVRSIFVDSRRRIWLGLGAGEINVIDLGAGAIRHLNLQGVQGRRDVQAFAETADGSIWAGTQGLVRINPDTFAIQQGMLPQLRNMPVLSLLSETPKQLLIGTYEGLFRYHLDTHRLDHIVHQPGQAGSLVGDTLRIIARVGSGFWFGTTRGISVASRAGQSSGFTSVVRQPGNPFSLPNDFVGSITCDNRGRLWVSTFRGLGLLKHPDAGPPYRFRTIGVAQGLASGKVNASVADASNNLWISLASGLARIDAGDLRAHNLSGRDGLHITSYVSTAAARAPDGSLLFGGLGGLTVVRPHNQPARYASAPLAITQAVLNDKPVFFGELPENGGTVTLSPDARSLRLEFALLDYRDPSDTSYRYRMEPFDKDWTQIPRGSLPSAIYTNLPHGSYTLRLQATLRGMAPHTVETDLYVQVQPRWYETVPARLFGVLLLALAITALIHLRTIYLRRQAHQLQQQIDSHTLELRAANQRLDELAGSDQLTGAYNRHRFLELARRESDLAQDRSTCMALLDLDHFKDINDAHGHPAGDTVLREVIAVIRRLCRRDDLVGRYGGEEFLLCFPATALDQALARAEQIRAAVADAAIDHAGRHIHVTVSIGVAQLLRGENLDQWLARADAALYKAKREGRNRCVADR